MWAMIEKLRRLCWGMVTGRGLAERRLPTDDAPSATLIPSHGPSPGVARVLSRLPERESGRSQVLQGLWYPSIGSLPVVRLVDAARREVLQRMRHGAGCDGWHLLSRAARACRPAPISGPAGPVAERRHVTVLFADLVGFTPFAEERDAEEVREVLTRYFDMARAIIDSYGGTVEKFIGDAAMAVRAR